MNFINTIDRCISSIISLKSYIAGITVLLQIKRIPPYPIHEPLLYAAEII